MKEKIFIEKKSISVNLNSSFSFFFVNFNYGLLLLQSALCSLLQVVNFDFIFSLCVLM